MFCHAGEFFCCPFNRHLQDNINQRQADINKGTSLTSLNQGLVEALAEAAIKTGDVEAKELLAAQGISIRPDAMPSAKTSTKK